MYSSKLVTLREYRQEDIDRALSFVNSQEVSRLIATNAPFPYTRGDEERWINGQSATKDTYNFAIETVRDHLYIGGCGLNSIDWKNRSCVVGIMIGDHTYWGKGYGTDAMMVLLHFIFEQLGLHRVSLYVFAYNARARRSYEKCGFVREGTLRKSLYRDGQFHDEYLMSILREDFDKLPPTQ